MACEDESTLPFFSLSLITLTSFAQKASRFFAQDARAPHHVRQLGESSLRLSRAEAERRRRRRRQRLDYRPGGWRARDRCRLLVLQTSRSLLLAQEGSATFELGKVPEAAWMGERERGRESDCANSRASICLRIDVFEVCQESFPTSQQISTKTVVTSIKTAVEAKSRKVSRKLQGMTPFSLPTLLLL